MKIADDEAHVCLGKGEVQAGDRVTLLRNRCSGPGNTEGARQCSLEKTGEGTITRILNDHYSVMKTDRGTEFAEGTLVQKL